MGWILALKADPSPHCYTLKNTSESLTAARSKTGKQYSAMQKKMEDGHQYFTMQYFTFVSARNQVHTRLFVHN